jgi:hypothetical protein
MALTLAFLTSLHSPTCIAVMGAGWSQSQALFKLRMSQLPLLLCRVVTTTRDPPGLPFSSPSWASPQRRTCRTGATTQQWTPSRTR